MRPAAGGEVTYATDRPWVEVFDELARRMYPNGSQIGGPELPPKDKA